MKTERYINDQNEFRCFGFPNSFVSKSDVLRILKQIPGIEIHHFSKKWGEEVFCEFIYAGNKFEVSEPYGDNSYFDITCENANTPELEEIYNVFERHGVSEKIYTRNKLSIIFWALVFIVIFAFAWGINS
jgi:hypothetical protein